MLTYCQNILSNTQNGLGTSTFTSITPGRTYAIHQGAFFRICRDHGVLRNKYLGPESVQSVDADYLLSNSECTYDRGNAEAVGGSYRCEGVDTVREDDLLDGDSGDEK
jgi:hypothetical protein